MLNKNDYVKIKDTNLCGVISNINKNKCVVNINNKNIITNLSDVVLCDKPKTTSTPQINVTVKYDTTNDFIPEIMLRHQYLSEAIENLDRFIDKAILNKAPYVKIIHGKSGGTIRKGVIEYLKNSEHIESFRLGYVHEGSYGVTIAKLK